MKQSIFKNVIKDNLTSCKWRIKMKPLILFMMGLCLLSIVFPRNEKREINLKGKWKFETGDSIIYANPTFDDSRWQTVRVPEPWEDEGAPNYDGYAWYRISCYIPDRLEGKTLYLALGKIDDVDETYLNGRLLSSSGTFPPNYATAFNDDRFYFIPKDFINFNGDNILAVRVYDESGSGGIITGNVGIYSVNQVPLLVNLSGQWKFRLGDNESWNRFDLNEREWQSIMVPGTWENQGYQEYDGFAWYRKSVFINYDWSNEKLILSLGRIDDLDEVFINGEKVGGVGPIDDFDNLSNENDFWNQERYYYIPPNLLRVNQENKIAVRVYDKSGFGGIYDGAIGITTQKEYLKYKDTKSGSFWDKFFDN
jgi:hypothetical protein